MFQNRIANSLLPFALAAASFVAASAAAQVSSNVTVIATGLNGPRGLAFGPDGHLYIAEAGTGGTLSTVGVCTQVPGPIGPYRGGQTGSIVRLDAGGQVTTVASGFPSTVDSVGDFMGVADITFLNGNLYALTAGGGCSHGNPNLPNQIAKVNLTHGSWKTVSDLSAFIQQHPTLAPDLGDFEPDGAPYSLISSDGKLLAVEANHGQVLSISPEGQIKRLIDTSSWQGHIVPTTIAEYDGTYYLGNLSVFPSIANAAEVITLSAEDRYFGAVPGLDDHDLTKDKLKIVSSKAGFTEVICVRVGPDGLLYALELSSAAGYPTPGLGKVVRVRPDSSIEDVATGLSVPTGMTFGPDGKLYVSNWGAAGPGMGQIVEIAVH